MRRIVVAIMGTISGLVLLFSYHTSTNSSSATDPTGTSSGGAVGTSGTSGTSGSTSAGSTPTGTSAETFTGDAVTTQWGVVQVEITVTDGKITEAQAVQYPNSNHHDQQINAYAVPKLNEAAVQAQSANLDAVSGATVTSNGYIESLQSAIDQANL